MSDANQATIKQLNSLIHLDFDAIETYDAAIKRVLDEPVRTGLLEFREDYERHTQVLAEWVGKLGGKPATHGDLKAILGKGKIAMSSLSENMGILKALQTNAEEMCQRYDQAVEEITEPAALVTTLEHHQADVRKHKSWIDNHLGETNQKPYPVQIGPNSH